MARKVFYSFHYARDSWRVQQVVNMGAVEGQPILTPNAWEAVEKDGGKAIQAWIDSNLKGKSCLVVLVGRYTAGRRWVKYEIKKAWNDGKGVVGVYIHILKDQNGNQDVQGRNPFNDFTLRDGTKLSSIVKAYNPPYSTSTNVHSHIKKKLADWVEEAIAIRNGA